MIKNLIFVLLILGLFLPTSAGGQLKNFHSAYTLFLILALIWIIIRTKEITKIQFFMFAGVNLVLLVATWITPFHEYAIGSYFAYLALSIIFLLRIKDVQFTRKHIILFKWINTIIVALGFLVIAKNHFAINLFIDNYGYYYDNLVRFSMYLQKPVLMFASHSIAAFYFYILFYLNFEMFKKDKKLSSLVLFVSYIVLMSFLNSFTTYILLAIALVQVVSYFVRRKPLLTITATIISFLVVRTKVFVIYEEVKTIVLSPNNGIIGRFKSTGYQSQNLEYVADNFYRPVGFGYSDSLFFGDSGIVETLVRGSLLLLIFVYAGVIIFYKNNLVRKRDAIFLFALFLMMEVGYTSLIYFRSLFIIPFLIVYLNTIRNFDFVKVKKEKKELGKAA